MMEMWGEKKNFLLFRILSVLSGKCIFVCSGVERMDGYGILSYRRENNKIKNDNEFREAMGIYNNDSNLPPYGMDRKH